ncbi:MAG: class I SAM-dependent methyltransferase [Flavobacteriia bacterium]|jgi:SAM-dependent methyltransferase
MEVQVDSSHYDFFKYVDIDRFNSFYYQLLLIKKICPKSILDIGPGNNFLRDLLSKEFDFKTIDIDSELDPDFNGSVDAMPLENNSFDLVCCFQVLEHLPFDKFDQCLSELNRVSRENVLLSLPYSRLDLKFSFKFTIFKELRLLITIPKFYKKNKFDGQHYWEIGRRNTPSRLVQEMIEKYFVIEEVINPFENPYHIFYKLRKK